MLLTSVRPIYFIGTKMRRRIPLHKSKQNSIATFKNYLIISEKFLLC